MSEYRMKTYFAAAVALLAMAACSEPKAPVSIDPPKAAYFHDTAGAAGLDFVHVNGASKRKYLPEIMGSGGSVLDYDGDGWMDLYLVQSGRLPGSEVAVPEAGNRLFRNRGDGTFEDVPSFAGDIRYGLRHGRRRCGL